MKVGEFVGLANLFLTKTKLVKALNLEGYNLTFQAKQYMGVEGRLHNYYTISQGVWDEDKRKFVNHELFSSGSMLQIVFFLRDLWYSENGQELPTDNEMWNQMRIKIREDVENG